MVFVSSWAGDLPHVSFVVGVSGLAQLDAVTGIVHADLNIVLSLLKEQLGVDIHIVIV